MQISAHRYHRRCHRHHQHEVNVAIKCKSILLAAAKFWSGSDNVNVLSPFYAHAVAGDGEVDPTVFCAVACMQHKRRAQRELVQADYPFCKRHIVLKVAVSTFAVSDMATVRKATLR